MASPNRGTDSLKRSMEEAFVGAADETESVKVQKIETSNDGLLLEMPAEIAKPSISFSDTDHAPQLKRLEDGEVLVGEKVRH